MSDDKISQLIRRADVLFASPERFNQESNWDEISEFMLNNQSGLFRRAAVSSTDLGLLSNSAPGSKRTKNVFDSSAMQCVQDLASAFQGTITNPATVWSTLRFHSDELNNNQEAVEWLEQANKVMHNKFNESNFNTEIAKCYQSFVALANTVLFFEETDSHGYRFTSVHLSQISWAENKDGIVDTIFRKFTFTAKQAKERWGNKLHPDILKALVENPDKEFDFMHVVLPRDPKEVKLSSTGYAPGKKRPIASLYIDMSHKDLVEEDGYYEMCILVGRWSMMPGEKYGRGPGHIGLPDVKTLNRLKRRGLESIDKQVAPPIFANRRDVIGNLDLRPNGISIVNDINGIREFVSQARTDVLQFSVEDLKASIRSIFYLDKLMLPPRDQIGEMTAYETAQRAEEMQRVLGPVLSRLNSELLSPLVVRAFKINLRSPDMPPMPAILKQLGLNIEIVFVNQLARAQQIQDVNTIQQWVQGLMGLAQAKPDVLDNINEDGVAKHTAKVLGVPEIAIQNDDVMAQNRQARAQAQQQAVQMQQGVQAADIKSKLDNSKGTTP